ncbi:MAG: NADH-quinone oxidoreductase subunit [Acidimicrobiaceae bacterium]|jgi:NADH-quinone oxidoreductase subunit H|nr:NADH-quinone oxidoreductase subunit [Acidimicrobiaceae bacterium]
MGDPLLNHGIDLVIFLIVCLKAVIVFAVVLVSVLAMVVFERKVIGHMQNRIGPNRAGPYGLLQSLADGTKLFFKEALLPGKSDKRIYRLAPFLAVVPAFLVFAIVPIGGAVSIFGHQTRLQLADPPWGILFMLMLSSIAVYGVMLAGWASGSKYPLLGAVRASAQMISYEAAMGLSIATVVVLSGSLRTSVIAGRQYGLLHFRNFTVPLPAWNLFRSWVVPFIIFMMAITAEMHRPPFDLVEAEEELAGGFNTEYSSLGFALFYLAEFMNVVTMSGITVTLFLGGPIGPRLFGNSIGPFWFLLKIFCFLFTYVWLRATLPRFRYDQLMDLGWKRLIPAGLGMLLFVAAVRTGSRGWVIGVLAGLVAGAALLLRALSMGQRTTLIETAIPHPGPVATGKEA